MKYLIRILAFGLVIFSMQRAWAGYWIYSADSAFKAKEFLTASSLSAKALQADPRNPYALYLQGTSLYYAKSSFGEAAVYLEAAARKQPYIAKGWYLLAAAQIAAAEQAGKMTPAEWQEIFPLLVEANRREPENGWLSYVVGKKILTYAKWSTAVQRNYAMAQFKRSTEFHYPNRPSPYLEPIWNFLWLKTENFKSLEDITPKDYASYKALLRFTEKQGLKQYSPQVLSVLKKFNDELYIRETTQAAKLLETNPVSAKKMFLEAYWKRKDLMPAKAGLLAASSQIGELPEDYQETLLQVLKSEEDYPEAVWKEIGKLVYRADDAVITAAYKAKKAGGKAAA